MGPPAPARLQQVETVHPRHSQIGHDHLDVVRVLKQRKGFLTRGCCLDDEVFFERQAEDIEVVRLVVDEQDNPGAFRIDDSRHRPQS